MSDPATLPPVTTELEDAWDKLFAKLDAVAPTQTKVTGEQQALAILRTLAAELDLAGKALESAAEQFKWNGALRLANRTILQSRRAREAAKAILG
jgi:hypothetical protein